MVHIEKIWGQMGQFGRDCDLDKAVIIVEPCKDAFQVTSSKVRARCLAKALVEVSETSKQANVLGVNNESAVCFVLKRSEHL